MQKVNHQDLLYGNIRFLWYFCINMLRELELTVMYLSILSFYLISWISQNQTLLSGYFVHKNLLQPGR